MCDGLESTIYYMNEIVLDLHRTQESCSGLRLGPESVLRLWCTKPLG